MPNNKKIYSLYIHIPFCKHICYYCDFPKMFPIKKFINNYIKTLIFELESLNINHKLKTIYIGGGTPTSINLTPLLKKLKKYIYKNTEFTIEGNINDFNKKNLLTYKKNGINRISLGIQSTDDKILKILGRTHKRKDVFKKVKIIKKYFSNINADLLYGFDELNTKKINQTINDYLSLGFQHISAYSLEINKNTIFFNQNKKPIDDNLAFKQFDYIFKTLTKNEFIRYETSNFALKNFESKHNLNYWKNNEYYGIGLGASGFINNVRYKNTLNINSYIKKNIIYEKEEISLEENKKYYIMLNLRTSSGINIKEYKKKFHEDFFQKNKETINYLIEKKLLKKNKKNITTTYSGSMVLNRILLYFF